MFTRQLIVMTVLLALVSACAPTGGTDVFQVGVEPVAASGSNDAIKDELQPILKAMLGGSITEQLDVIQYTQVACANLDGLGAPPRCPEGVAEGTLVEVFPMLGPEGSFAKPEEMENVLTNALVKGLHAVYRVTPNPNIEPYFPEGEYAMLFERDVNDVPLPVVLRVMDGKVVRMDFRFSVSAADILREIPVEQILIAPQEAKAWTDVLRP